MNIAALGPAGTFSHQACQIYDPDLRIMFKKSFRGIFDAVENGETLFGIIPVENTISGIISPTIDLLLNYDLKIISEIVISVIQNLVGYGNLNDIKKLYVKSEVYLQCEKFINSKLKHADIVETFSTAQSARYLDKLDITKSAIISDFLSKTTKVPVIAECIQESRDNKTRFFLLSKKTAAEPYMKDKEYKTALVVIPKSANRPGVLYGLLGSLAKRKLNLTNIVSRPLRGKMGDYLFFMELEGHAKDPVVEEALQEIKKTNTVKVFGSYIKQF